MTDRCDFVHPDGRQCKAWAMKGEKKCIFHCDKKAIAARVYDEEWTTLRRVRLLSRRLAALKSIRDEAVRTRLTLDILKALDLLEERVKKNATPPAETTTEKKLAEWEKSQR